MDEPFHHMVTEAKRLLATSEFRSIQNKHERVGQLVLKNGISFRAAASASGMSLGAVQRAVNAVKRDDQPGKLGRPSALTTTEEQQLRDTIRSEHASLNSIPPSVLIEKASSVPQSISGRTGWMKLISPDRGSHRRRKFWRDDARNQITWIRRMWCNQL